jgi:hypothetical protein
LAVDQFGEYPQHNGLELLRVFDINTPIANREDLAVLLGYQSNPKVRRLLGRPSMSWATGRSWCNEPHFDYWSAIQKIKQPTYVHGYWQSEQYFVDFAHLIRNDLTFRNDLDASDLAVKERMSTGPSASLHVRRGDYLKRNFRSLYANCSVSYYISAVQLLREKIPGVKLFVFSDEPDWVVKYIAPELGKIDVVSHNTGSRSANDMRLMSLADHHIIANSSFSWWGAWLNPRKEKIVIAPKTWFADGRPVPSLIPSPWIRL